MSLMLGTTTGLIRSWLKVSWSLKLHPSGVDKTPEVILSGGPIVLELGLGKMGVASKNENEN